MSSEVNNELIDCPNNNNGQAKHADNISKNDTNGGKGAAKKKEISEKFRESFHNDNIV